MATQTASEITPIIMDGEQGKVTINTDRNKLEDQLCKLIKHLDAMRTAIKNNTTYPDLQSKTPPALRFHYAINGFVEDLTEITDFIKDHTNYTVEVFDK